MKPTDALPHPLDWNTTTVKQSVEIKRGISWSKEQEHSELRNGHVPVIRISNVQEKFVLDDLLYLSGLKPEAVENKRVSKGWSIMVGSNGNRNRVGNAVLIREDTNLLFASFLIAARPYQSHELKPEYFFRWLTTEQVQAYLSAASEGTTGLNNLSHGFFKAMAIPVPPREEQEAIARILDAVDAAIERTREAIEKSRELRDSLIHRLLQVGVRNEKSQKSKVGLIPQSWACERLGDYLASGPTNGLYRPESDYGNRGTRIVRIDSFDSGKIHDISVLRRVNVAPIIAHRYSLQEGDLLINRVNSLSHIGKAAIVPRLEEQTIFESNMMVLRCDKRLLPEFLILVLCSDIARRHWLARAKPAVNQASINQRDVRELVIPIPKIDEQGKIVQIISAADNHLAQLRKLISAQQNLKKSLMHDQLTGKVRVNHNNMNSHLGKTP